MSYPFRTPVSDSNWEPPDYAKPVTNSTDNTSDDSSSNWKPPSYATSVAPEVETKKPSVFSRAISGAENFLSNKEPLDVTKAIPAQLKQLATEHPKITDFVRRALTDVRGENTPEAKQYPLQGPGFSEIPGVRQASSWLRQKGTASGDYWKGFGSSISGDILESAATGFDPRTAGAAIPNAPIESLREPGILFPKSPLRGEIPYRTQGELPATEIPTAKKPLTDYFKKPGVKPTATFAYEGPEGKMYNISGGASDKSTVGEDTLNKLGIEVPTSPESSTEKLSGDQLRARALATRQSQIPEKPELPPNFTAVGEEPSVRQPQETPKGTEDILYDIARKKFNMGWEPPSYAEEVPKTAAPKTIAADASKMSPDELSELNKFMDSVKGEPPKVELPEKPSETPTETPTPPTLADRTVERLQSYEDAALERIKQRGTFKGGRLLAGLPVDDLADFAVIGATKIAKGAVKFADFSAQMIKDFGETIRPHLQAIFEAAQAKHAQINNPATKLTDALEDAKPLEEAQAAVYSKERGERIGKAAGVTTKGEAGFHEQLSELKGEHSKVEFEPLRGKLQQNDIDSLFDTITNHPSVDDYQKINAKEGLTRILDGSVPQKNQIDILEKVFGKDFASKLPVKAKTDDFLTKLANLSTKTTRAVLGFHIPGTALSFHGFNEAIRNTMFGPDFNPFSAAGRFANSTNYLIRPGKAQAFLDANVDNLSKAIEEGGLRVETGDIGFSSLFKGENILTKGFNALTSPKPLFGRVIPALKLKGYQGLLEQYEKQGISHAVAAKAAGEATNNIFGGLNLHELERSPTTQKLFRATTLAPDWLESNVRLGKGMFNAIKNPMSPQSKIYLSGISNFLGSYIALNVINAINNDGKFSFQNDVGHEFDVAIGKDALGRVRYFSPYGTAMDMFRIPLEIGHAAAEGNLGRAFTDIRSRASEPVQFLTDLTTNTDYAGRALYDKTKYGKLIPPIEQGTNIAADAAGHFLPIGAESGINFAQGKISPEQFAAQVLQAPMKYKLPDKTKGPLSIRKPKL